MVLSIRGNGVDSCFFCCGYTKSTLFPDGLSATNFFWAMNFLKSTSSLVSMAPEFSVCSLLILFIPVFRFYNFSLTVSYLFIISSISFLICFSRFLSVVSTLSAICCSFASVALSWSYILFQLLALFFAAFQLLLICSNFANKSPSLSEVVFDSILCFLGWPLLLV